MLKWYFPWMLCKPILISSMWYSYRINESINQREMLKCCNTVFESWSARLCLQVITYLGIQVIRNDTLYIILEHTEYICVLHSNGRREGNPKWKYAAWFIESVRRCDFISVDVAQHNRATVSDVGRGWSFDTNSAKPINVCRKQFSRRLLSGWVYLSIC